MSLFDGFMNSAEVAVSTGQMARGPFVCLMLNENIFAMSISLLFVMITVQICIAYEFNS